MLWRGEKTEGVRRSAAVSMNGGYSPRQLPRSHAGPAWAALSPSSCPAQCKPPSAAHTLIPTLLTPLSDPLCAPLLPACSRLPRGKFGGRRGSAGVGRGRRPSAGTHNQQLPLESFAATNYDGEHEYTNTSRPCELAFV